MSSQAHQLELFGDLSCCVEDEPVLWRLAIEALLAEGATMVDAIEGATMLVRARRRSRDDGAA